ncbi:type II toxin-antitoxin system VapC family toxin [Saccharothrix sp. 6-C]|uniref:type II toxin-antitoxin system VapC family toxin n=1 Tax=Saccharothrix sp. 6-C TaxID=2781735 RepID=UPI001917328F|nr:type II toxin-antitoxin system VapC family toxin [Saccharothrix sp. 6-C]QQQ75486.1 type II toxin-antitoxin system VapC family toxin [Saccharothrix sp. 6-C]
MAGDAYIVDTGVFVRWFIEQVGFEHAREVRDAYLGGHAYLETIDHVRFEFGNVLRKFGLLTRLIERDEYVAASRVIDDLGITIHITDVDAAERAAVLAADKNISYYDALLVDRSLERGLPLLTTDKKLCNAVSGFAKTQLLRGI